MSANLTVISEILKDQYLPVLKNQITTKPSPFLELIRKTELTSGGKITAVAPFGIGGGFGFGAEGNGTPKSGARTYKRFEIDPVDMYVDIRISDKAMKLANDRAAVVSALDEEIRGSYEAAKWNVARALFGDGSGKLCTIPSAASPSSGILTLSVSDTATLIEGLTVDLYTYSATTSTTPELSSGNKALRVIDIDRANGTVKLECVSGGTDKKSTSADNYGFLVVQNSYMRELTGLGAIFDDNVTTLYGYTKSTSPFIVPLTVDASHSISDTVIYDAVKKAMDYRNSDIDLVMMGDDAFRAYQAYMRDNNVVVCEKAQFVGGASGYKVMVGSRTVTVVNEKLVPTDEAWCVDTSAFSFVSVGFDFCEGSDGSVFRLEPGTSYYRALLASYGNLICKNPGGCVKITNCDETGA